MGSHKTSTIGESMRLIRALPPLGLCREEVCSQNSETLSKGHSAQAHGNVSQVDGNTIGKPSPKQFAERMGTPKLPFHANLWRPTGAPYWASCSQSAIPRSCRGHRLGCPEGRKTPDRFKWWKIQRSLKQVIFPELLPGGLRPTTVGPRQCASEEKLE